MKMKVGSLVECIAQNIPKEHGVINPESGAIYTVRRFSKFGRGVMLEEIINPNKQYLNGYDEAAFLLKHFRELQPPMDLSELLEVEEINVLPLPSLIQPLKPPAPATHTPQVNFNA